MIGQADAHDCNLAYFTKTRAGKQKKKPKQNKTTTTKQTNTQTNKQTKRYYRTTDYRIGNRTHTAKFKVVRNVRLFPSYSIDSNLQDEIAGQDGVSK